MSARILRFPGAIPNHPPARLRLIEDEYAAKVTADADRRFWVRVEREGGDTIVVSDFAVGELSESDLIEGLRLALRALDHRGRAAIRFMDIVPGGMDKPLFGMRLERAAELVKRLSWAIASDSGRRITAFNICQRGDKMDAVARFS
ncbi:hypothetical protein MesoLjLc_04650 [Mesorhizobium sp. L-8-10]|uniref:hypothetical protein n=1 Tax=unclassified Mesorhizobium TaxID=325217 RepID=UPI00192850E7|nr:MULTISPECIES: hypothetical protein [unclassified Mesorhizobium]BCH20691.1 hypothetical protein MesoLjLb_04760 [Mesorhizobium sp. L-8-3]BCH28535.1 hypothetical protein MesoLjLc_04650 [Mesorhizobium sp. L-8-10]